jgi:hypothetical protein
VERYTSDGISLVASTATKLFVLNTVSRDNVTGGDGLSVDAVNATVEIVNSHFDRNASSGAYLKVAKATVTGGTASGNGSNGIIIPVDALSVRITETAADDNSQYGFEIRNNDLPLLESAKARGNGVAGLLVQSGAIAVITRCVFSDIGGASVGVDNMGVLLSAGNNLISSRAGAALGSVTEQ